MRLRLTWVGVLATLVHRAWSVAAEGSALLNRMHVGRVKAVDLRENRLMIEGMFHDRSLRDIPVTLEPEAPIINPDVMNRTRAVPCGDIRLGYSVALECGETGKRHTARKVTITSTKEEEGLQRAPRKASRGAPPGLRGTGSAP